MRKKVEEKVEDTKEETIANKISNMIEDMPKELREGLEKEFDMDKIIELARFKHMLDQDPQITKEIGRLISEIDGCFNHDFSNVQAFLAKLMIEGIITVNFDREDA